MKTLKHYTFVTVMVLFCTIYCNGQNSSQSAINIYIAGSYMDGNTEKACYWKNGVRTDLDGIQASGIYISDGKIYLAGTFLKRDYWGGNNHKLPCYWIDGVRTAADLSSGNYEVKSMTVINGSVYFSARNTNGTDYFIYGNGSIQVDTKKKYINYITSSDGALLFSLNDDVASFYSAYGQSVHLGNSVPHGIFVDNGSIYVAGSSYAYTSNYFIREFKPCYWVDGIKKELPGDGSAERIGVANGVIHITGSKYVNGKNEPIYWINGLNREIPSAASFSEITVFEGSVYITGSFRQGGINMACYWVNGERFALPGGRSATGICIVRE